MKTTLYVLLIALILSACGSPAPLSTPTPQPTATTAPTATRSPTSTPAPTPTRAPVALTYEGWKDKAFSSACVEIVLLMKDAHVPTDMQTAAIDLLSAMGMEVIPTSTACEVTFFLSIFMIAQGETVFKASGESCSTYKELISDGYLEFFAPSASGGDGITIYLNDGLELPNPSQNCDPSREPPFELLWPKTLLNAFYELYGEQALEAAESVPVLQPFVSEIAR